MFQRGDICIISFGKFDSKSHRYTTRGGIIIIKTAICHTNKKKIHDHNYSNEGKEE